MPDWSCLTHQRLLLAAFATALCGLAACTTLKGGAHQYPGTDFDGYTSFSWIADDPWIVSGDDAVSLSPLTRRMIQDALQAGFEDRGYRFEPNRERADFVVAYTVGTRERISVSSYPEVYRRDWDWFPHSHDYPHPGYQSHAYTEGTLGVDVFDGASRQPVWHGWASKPVTEADRADPSPSIDRAVGSVVDRFPARRPGA